jgi:hypothetical protein
MRKTRLELDTLAVESFDTTSVDGGTRGTVNGREIEPTPPEYPCTCRHSDLCKTAYYYCGTGPYTIYSCDYTQNGSCAVTA